MKKNVCKNCGMDLYPDEKICPYCGQPVKRVKKGKPFIIAFGILLVIGLVLGIVYALTSKDDFQKNYNRAYELMGESAYDADEICYKTLIIWYNCVAEESAIETDAYTMDDDGHFYEDFNDALENYYNSDEYTEYADYIFDNSDEVYDLMEYFNEYEEENEDKNTEAISAIWSLYSVYWDMIDLAFNAECTYGTFYDYFIEYDETFYDAWSLAEQYITD